MSPFVLSHIQLLPREQHVAWGMSMGATRAEAEAHFDEIGGCVRHANERYVVMVRDCPRDMNPTGLEGLVWMSIRRRDGRPLRDWGHLQWIKNQILGPEGEAVEVFPRESRKVDCENQYHLFGSVRGIAPVGFMDVMAVEGDAIN